MASGFHDLSDFSQASPTDYDFECDFTWSKCLGHYDNDALEVFRLD